MPRGGALVLLKEAHDLSKELGRHLWDFAIEIGELRAAGLSISGLRWLVCKGLVEHASDITPMGQQVRTFGRTGGLVFCEKTCFVITEAGRQFLGGVHGSTGKMSDDEQGTRFAGDAACPAPGNSSSPTSDSNGQQGTGASGGAESVLPSPAVRTPKWDSERRELRVGDRVVKQFKVPAPGQQRILAAFEEEGWPPCIDDPLPPAPDQDAKRRLHDMINALNRCHRHALIRFMGNGSGEGVRWEWVDAGNA